MIKIKVRYIINEWVVKQHINKIQYEENILINQWFYILIVAHQRKTLISGAKWRFNAKYNYC